MKCDFSVSLKDLDGKVFSDQIAMQTGGYYIRLAAWQNDPKTNKEPKQIDLTLGAASRHALCSTFNDEKELSGEDKFERGMLASRIKRNDGALSAEEITLVKRLLGKLYGPEVIISAWPLLDPAVKDKKKK